MAEVYHIPALLEETMEGLSVRPGGVYVDVTLGGGGHSRAILERLGEKGMLYSFDQDQDALREALGDGAKVGWKLVHGNFRYIRNFLDFYGVSAYSADDPESGVDGVLADLGVSFHHFDEAARGFSFRFTGPLDMRMNQQGGKTAADVLNTYSEEALAKILYLYGEVKNGRQLAHKIVLQRAKEPFERTEQLTALITGGNISIQAASEDSEERREETVEVDARYKKDLARVYQALRMEVNDEMGALEEMLEGAKAMLRPGGRMAVLTYHSLEDRMVKNFFRSGNVAGEIEKDFYGNVLSPFRLVNRQVIVASEEEVARNPRSRSAKLRVAEKI